MLTNTTSNAEQLVSAYLQAFETLKAERDLSPHNPVINRTLSHLVRLVSKEYSPEAELLVTNDERVRAAYAEMLKLLSRAEAEMEFYYARVFHDWLFLEQGDLQRFMYWQNYESLIETEVQGLEACGRILQVAGKESVAFVGAGPFPLSAILLYLTTGVSVTCVDLDEEACAVSAALLSRLGLSEQIRVVSAAGDEYDYALHPYVFMASLIPNKREVVERLRATRPDSVLGVRSADGVQTLLYEPVNETEMEALGCTKIGRTYADTRIINSTLYYQV